MDAKPESQIDYIEFPATDIEGSKRFYSTVFGWKFEDYGQSTRVSATGACRADSARVSRRPQTAY